jgi:hypothetical protein
MTSRYYGTRIMDFNICCEHPIIYIKEPLMLHRLHLGNDSFRAADNLMEVMGPYVLNLQFVDQARSANLQNVVDRFPASIEKISRLSMRYSVRALIAGSERNALRYFHLAAAIFPEIAEDETFRKLAAFWMADSDEKTRLLKGFAVEKDLVTRLTSYDPPSDSEPISFL